MLGRASPTIRQSEKIQRMLDMADRAANLTLPDLSFLEKKKKERVKPGALLFFPKA